jgi:hypothetical protein
MPEIPDRLPGEIIAAEHPNVLRQRAAQRYLDVAARDASVPLPETGEPAYLTSSGLLQVFDGSIWVDQLNALGGQVLTGSKITMGLYDTTASTPIEWQRLAGGNLYLSRVAGEAAYFRIRTGVDGDTAKNVEQRFSTGAGDALAPRSDLYFAGDTTTPVFTVTGVGGESSVLRTPLIVNGKLTVTDEGTDGFREFILERDGKSFQIETQGTGFQNVNIKAELGIGTGAQIRFFAPAFATVPQVFTIDANQGPFVNSENVQNRNNLELRTIRNILTSTTEPTSGDGEDGDVWLRIIAP